LLDRKLTLYCGPKNSVIVNEPNYTAGMSVTVTVIFIFTVVFILVKFTKLKRYLPLARRVNPQMYAERTNVGELIRAGKLYTIDTDGQNSVQTVTNNKK